ncbi:NB-ARC domain-containing protein [Dolichospermum circinale]|uniref:NB-ARC domain-containing protein n=1 Tax=Dolichospermum circinale TaxID=109265 RepID=UPI00232D90B5|nr:NB-ARC domain-containing protein [Dolichospermum circinale]MDB9453487.1 NB-ARC domain-containing protein [Dolichospermum circinale CS-541/06]MDB9462600.1 NB-ARC domain-containing protein [Dolichospermum circinale CS-541/04]
MLNIEEIIEIADNQVFEHQGQHLNDLQRAILEGTLQGRTYADIAKEHQHSEKYIKDSASKLWKSLSQAVGKKVNKFNVKSTLGRCSFSSTNIFKGIQINSGNLFKESAPSSENDEIIHKKEQITSHLDLKDAPEIGDFYGRKVELSLLQQKILQGKCNLITLLGIKGIGKTALALKLVDHIKENFEFVIYKSLKSLPSLTQLITEIIYPHDQLIQDNSPHQLSQFKKAIENHSYLIIIDDVNYIFSKHQVSGKYQPGYEEYGNLFKLLSTTKHRSCLIINSSEEIRQLSKSQNDHSHVFTLELLGLDNDGVNILKKYGLKNEENYQKLLNIYQGTPQYLHIIGYLIQELFAGDTNKFLQLDQPFLDIELTAFLEQSLDILPPSEVELLHFIASQNGSILLSELENSHQVYELIVSSIQSLKRRFLISTQQINAEVSLEISSLIRKFYHKLDHN